MKAEEFWRAASAMIEEKPKSGLGQPAAVTNRPDRRATP